MAWHQRPSGGDQFAAGIRPDSPDGGQSCASSASCGTPTPPNFRSESSACGSPATSLVCSVGQSIWEHSLWGRSPATNASFANVTPSPVSIGDRALDDVTTPHKAPRLGRTGLQSCWLGDVQAGKPATVACNRDACTPSQAGVARRRLFDKRYYITELRERCRRLQEEIHSLREELQSIQDGNLLASSVAKRCEMARKQRDKLKGRLKDHVLVDNHLRSCTSWQVLQDLLDQIKAKNAALTAQLDGVFLEKKGWELEAQRASHELEEMELAVEKTFRELPKHEQEEYKYLVEEDERISNSLREARMAWLELDVQVEDLEARQRVHPLRGRYEELTIKREDLTQKLSQLRREVIVVSPAEHREALLKQVQQDKAETLAAERCIRALRLENESLRDELHDVSEMARDREQWSYKAVVEKDREMTEFIESFNEKKTLEEQRLNELGEAVVLLLHSMSRSVCRASNRDAEFQLPGLRADLGFTRKQLQLAEQTSAKLDSELASRQRQLEQLSTLDWRVEEELEAFKAQIAEYEVEISEKLDIEEMQSQGQFARLQLEARKKRLQCRARGLRHQAGLRKLQLEGKLLELAENRIAEDLDKQEFNIQRLRQIAFTIGSFVQKSNEESDCSVQEHCCTAIASDLNEILQRNLQRVRPGASTD